MHCKFSVSCLPEEMNTIRAFCKDNRLAISKFFVQAAFEKIERAKNGVFL